MSELYEVGKALGNGGWGAGGNVDVIYKLGNLI